eukprot:1605854-Rhodomonas_salina.1
MKLAAMVDVGTMSAGELPDKSSTVLDMVRVAGCCDQVEGMIELGNAAAAKGLEVALVLLEISCEKAAKIEATLARLAQHSQARTVYVCDTRGALYNEQVELCERGGGARSWALMMGGRGAGGAPHQPLPRQAPQHHRRLLRRQQPPDVLLKLRP